MPAYRWDVGAKRYRDTDTGRFLSREKALEYVDGALQAGRTATGTLANMVAEGTISAADWRDKMRQEVKDEYIRQYTSARGGVAVMTQADWGSIGGMLKEQYTYLDKFYGEVAAGNLTEGQIAARAGMYINSAREANERAHGRSQGMPDLDRYPGSGSTPCLTNCACFLTIETTKDGWDVYWKLGDAEHCFPAGVKVSTPTGTKNIENVHVGDWVETTKGPRQVTRLYSHFHSGNVHEIATNDAKVVCTPNHPFFTSNGWKRADGLVIGDNVVCQKDVTNNIERHIRVPDANNAISASGEIGGLGFVSCDLLDLSFPQLTESWVSMPPVAIGLNDKVSDLNIHDEIWFDEKKRFVINTEIVENSKHAFFEFCRVSLLDSALSLKKFFVDVGAIFPKLLGLFAQSFRSAWHLGRIVFPHILGGLVVYDEVRSGFRKYNFEAVGFTPDRFQGNAHSFTAPFRPLAGIVFEQKRDLLGVPVMPSGIFGIAHPAMPGGKFFWLPALADVSAEIRECLSPAFVTDIELPGAYLPALLTGPFRWAQSRSRAAFFTKVNIPILPMPTDGTGSKGDILGILSCHKKPPVLSLHPNSVTHNQIVPYSGMVYNLEVEEIHEYIADGFVVHNCDGCLELAASWSPLKVKAGARATAPVRSFAPDLTWRHGSSCSCGYCAEERQTVAGLL